MAAATMETNMNSLNDMILADNSRKCSSKNCKNDSIQDKETCEVCTENIDLKNELRRLRDENDEMKEHIVSYETSQKYNSKKHKSSIEAELPKEKVKMQNQEVKTVVNEVQKLLEKSFCNLEKTVKYTISEQLRNNSISTPPLGTYASAVSSNVAHNIKLKQKIELSKN